MSIDLTSSTFSLGKRASQLDSPAQFAGDRYSQKRAILVFNNSPTYRSLIHA